MLFGGHIETTAESVEPLEENYSEFQDESEDVIHRREAQEDRAHLQGLFSHVGALPMSGRQWSPRSFQLW